MELHHDKRSQWRERIEDWKQSGLSQSAFCRIHNLSLPSFGYWKRKLDGVSRELRLVPIERPAVLRDEGEGQGGLRLTIHGATVEVDSHVEMDLLAQVLDVLARSACGR